MYLDTPRKLKGFVKQAEEVARNVFRPISRKYDKNEHAYPKELDMLGSILDGMNDGAVDGGAGATRTKNKSADHGANVNGVNMSTCLGAIELCYGDTAFLLSLPRQGLGNAAIAAVANEEQLKRFDGIWAAMAITEPGCGSDSAAVRTTAIKDGDDYVINGEKIFVTAGDRAAAVVVWASVDPSLGKAAIKSFVVEKGTPGMEVTRLEKKLGIKASDTAVINFTDCRVPAKNLLGNEEVDVKKSFAGVMQTFDNTRPLVAAMALGVTKASLERARELLNLKSDYKTDLYRMTAIEAEMCKMEAEYESAKMLTLKAAWMADNRQPNSLEASMCKAKAGRVCNYVALKCVELCSSVGYAEDELLEKWARDSKILDIFEGTQQIQQLIVARRLLGKSSAELK